jgi:hypothetical protein
LKKFKVRLKNNPSWASKRKIQNKPCSRFKKISQKANINYDVAINLLSFEIKYVDVVSKNGI